MTGFMFLTYRMSMGYGVAVFVQELSRNLVQAGYSVCIGCLSADYEIPGVSVFEITPDPVKIGSIAAKNNADIIVAFTTPFFEILPLLVSRFKCYAWEAGDPSPFFFKDDADKRREIILNKQLHVYPNINGVIAISKFLTGKEEIHYHDAEVVYLGCDHIPDPGKKTLDDIALSNKPLKIGTLMRLGEGESLYKGNSLFFDLCQKMIYNNMNVLCHIMGRGTKEDANFFERNGYKVYRNATDEERAGYLREMDIFISPSLWEGFNLPLVEAMRSGTLAIAFDAGAHPEVCPFIFSNIDEMICQIKHYIKDRRLLLKDSERCYNYVNTRFKWRKTAASFIDVIKKYNKFSKMSGSETRLLRKEEK